MKNKNKVKEKDKINVIQRGNIYFFYRPKIESKVKEIQRFFFVLHRQDQENYQTIIIGKKQLPELKGESYFGFVDSVEEDKNRLVEFLKKKHYSTKTKGERTLPTSHCLGVGKYLLFVHNNHTHFIYQLTSPSQIKETQEEFNLNKKGDYLISVKNPEFTSSSSKIVSGKKTNYPDYLQKQLSNHHFIPLNSVDFLDYEGTELLLINIGQKNFQEKELSACLQTIGSDELLKEFAKIISPEK